MDNDHHHHYVNQNAKKITDFANFLKTRKRQMWSIQTQRIFSDFQFSKWKSFVFLFWLLHFRNIPSTQRLKIDQNDPFFPLENSAQEKWNCKNTNLFQPNQQKKKNHFFSVWWMCKMHITPKTIDKPKWTINRNRKSNQKENLVDFESQITILINKIIITSIRFSSKKRYIKFNSRKAKPNKMMKKRCMNGNHHHHY